MDSSTPPNSRSAALAAYAAGCSVAPIPPDGSKYPGKDWEERQRRRLTPDEIGRAFANPAWGLSLICGKISGGLEALDFDDAEFYTAFCDACEHAGIGELLHRIQAGYEERTPSGGTHILIRCSVVEKNTKLARRPDPARPKGELTLGETRGEGGLVVVAPSNGKVHPDGGAWQLVQGGFDSIVTVTPAERELLRGVMRSLDEMPAKTGDQPRATYLFDANRPGDDFRSSHGDTDGWRTILEPHGWVLVYEKGSVGFWRRPGKDRGISASTGYAGSDLLYCWSSSTVFDIERGYSPFSAYAILNHNGDYQVASQALQSAGYGKQPTILFPGQNKEQAAQDSDALVLPPEALAGLAGEFVALFRPNTESDDAALLAHLLEYFGNAVGRGPHTYVGEARHGTNIFIGLVGATSRSRKGTSSKPAGRVFGFADPDWMISRQLSGIGSGEGIIYAIRDPSEPKLKGGEMVVEDEGVRDKRGNIMEEELSSLLKVGGRDGSIVSETIRKAWDGPEILSNTVKGKPIKATGGHVSIIGHITREELDRVLTEVDKANGLGNRFCWVYTKRARHLADPQRLPDVEVNPLAYRIRRALEFGRTASTMRRTPEAAALWEQIYPELSKDYPGLFGAITARAEAHVLRLSLIYALLDQSNQIKPNHIISACAFWNYCEQSARLIFGDRIGDPVADRIMDALRVTSELSETAIHDLFGRNQKADRISKVLNELLIRKLVTLEERQGDKGRPQRVWALFRKEAA